MLPQSLAHTPLLAIVLAGAAGAQNDTCAGAIALNLGVSTPFDTQGATTSPPAWPCAAGGADLWYRVAATSTGSMFVSVCGSSFDTALEAFAGSCAGLTSLACSDDSCGLQSSVTFPVTAGAAYLVRVGGFNATAGSGTITASQAPLVPNDECAGAVALALNSPTVFDTTGATTSPVAWPVFFGGNDLWFTYTSTTGNPVHVQTCGSSFDTALEAFSNGCGGLTSLAFDDNTCGSQSRISWSATPGATYHIRVGSVVLATGVGTILVTESLPPNVAAQGGAPPNATSALDFDAPFVASGPIAANSAAFAGVGITSVSLVGTWTTAGDTLSPGANVAGQALVAHGGALTVAGPNEALDNPTAGAGFDLRLAAPATTFGVAFVDQVGFTYDVELFLGGTLIGNGRFVYGPTFSFPWPPEYWTCTAGAFDRVVITDTFGGFGWGIDDLRFDGTYPSVGTNYCAANPNSTGQLGRLTGSGSALAASNDLTLEASQLPLNAFGFFLTSATQASVPNPGGSQGVLCLGGAIGRYVGPGQIRSTGTSGSFSLRLDLTRVPTPTGPISVFGGQTRHFQAWHRDSNAGAATSNMTDGLSVVFQ